MIVQHGEASAARSILAEKGALRESPQRLKPKLGAAYRRHKCLLHPLNQKAPLGPPPPREGGCEQT